MHLATSHSECLAKLSAYGLSRHGLPIASCGGTWSGDSCEPWRTGGGSCENYIQPLDPDLNCLVRNTLWTYNQSVSNDSIQEQCTPTATKTSSTATRTKSGRNKSTSPAAIHEEQEQDAKEKKRRMNVIYAQRKREKERIEKDVYDKQILELHGSNVSLQQENAHLEQLIQAAAKEISAQRQRYEEEEEKSETRTSQQQEQQHHARPARPTAGTADAEANAAPTAAASSPLSVDSQQQQQNQESCSQNIHQ